MENVFTAYKQIEQTLRYLSIIAEQSSEGIVVIDLDGCIQFINDAWIDMHGSNLKDELIGKQLSVFHTKEQMKFDVAAMLKKTRQCGRIEGTIEHIKSDGTVFEMQTKMILAKDESGEATGFVIFAADIDQSTRLQEAVVESNKQINQLNERITQLRKLFSECTEVGQFLTKQTCELQENNEMILQQISEFDQSTEIPEQYSEQMISPKSPGIFDNEQPEEINSKPQQPNESKAERSKSVENSKRSMKLLDTKELVEVAELARRLSESS